MANHVRIVRSALLAACLLTAPVAVNAQEPPDMAESQEPERPLYGFALAGAYVAAPFIGMAGAAAINARAGLTMFMLTPPIVHLAYADPWWSLASLFAPIGAALSTSLSMVILSQCDWGLGGGFGGGSTCNLPMVGGAALGYLSWAAFDIAFSTRRARSRLHDNSKRPPRPVHEPNTPAPSPAARELNR